MRKWVKGLKCQYNTHVGKSLKISTLCTCG